MNSRVALAAPCGIAGLLSSPLFAHPGHGTTDPNSLLHHTTEWLHAGPWWMTVVAVTAAAAAAHLLWRRRRAAD